jgi:hypothetical protein
MKLQRADIARVPNRRRNDEVAINIPAVGGKEENVFVG